MLRLNFIGVKKRFNLISADKFKQERNHFANASSILLFPYFQVKYDYLSVNINLPLILKSYISEHTEFELLCKFRQNLLSQIEKYQLICK